MGFRSSCDGYRHYRNPEGQGFRADVREEAGALIRRGTIATDTPLHEFVRGMGVVMLQLAITDELLDEWRAEGVTMVPLLRNHGLNAEGGFYAWPDPERDAYGNLEAFAIESVGERNELAVDFRFVLAMTPEAVQGAVRSAPFIPTSVGYSYEAADLEILPEKHRNGLPIVRANRWRMSEGSITVVGHDPATHVRSNHVAPKKPTETRQDEGNITLSRAQFDHLLGTSMIRGGVPLEGQVLEVSTDPAEDIAARVLQRLDERDAKRAAPAAPAGTATEPTEEPAEPEQTDPWEELSERAKTELGEDVALGLIRDAKGQLGAFRAALKMALARKEKEQPGPAIEGGDTGDARALETFVAATMARGLKDETAKKEWEGKAGALDRGWRERGIVRTCRDMLLASERGYSHDRVYSQMGPVELVETAKYVSTRLAHERPVEMRGQGMLYYRTASGGLVPANLPAAYQDILDLSIQVGYQRYLLPLERLATRKDTDTFRKAKIVDLDASLEWRRLESHEQYLPIQLREGESSVKAEAYGHRYIVTEEALVNDDRGVLVAVPELMGQLYAEGKNSAFVLIVVADSNFGANQQTTENPLDYSGHVLAKIAFSHTQRPVDAPEGEEAGLTSGKSRVLTPTAGIWGELAYNAWWARTRELRVGDGIDSRSEASVHEPLVALRGNTHMALNLLQNQGVIWPGPESLYCPFAIGGVRGREGMRVRATSLMDTGERDALRYTISTTFYAKALEARVRHAYRFTDESINPNLSS